ncbi:putative hydrolase of the HAD superfamily [Actinacidiphila yanglinensis]|uniref:Putative hydrolase of the HAD superfamily n=1 Tax=Actinacidiphila yanglinensis TaxID=310779 RepID=A0A1H5YP38_9ACTN|nr:HAD-IA family hydrolase [Actinacidiphila yanglinensis]SEG25893.1 putative hydrolase of the HAD superfamily [Actinacidiphila yanglinensis]
MGEERAAAGEPGPGAPPFGYDAVLCDFDGVVHLWPPDSMSSLDLARGLPEGTLAAAAFRPELLDLAVTGAITDEEWRARTAADLAAVCGSAEAAAGLVAEWTARTGRLDPEVLALLADVRRHAPVVLVSNATTRLESYMAAIGVAGAFDAVLNTSRFGLAKPDPRVFAAAAALVGADPARCLFVDDTAGHVAAARAAGLTGLHYTHAGGLRAALAGRNGSGEHPHDSPAHA